MEALASRRRVHFAVNDHILINLRLAELHGAQGRLDEVPKPLYSCHLHRPPVTPLSRHLHPLPTQSHSYPTLAALLLPCASNRPTPSVRVPPPSRHLVRPYLYPTLAAFPYSSLAHDTSHEEEVSRSAGRRCA